MNKEAGPDDLTIEIIKKLRDTGAAQITSSFREAMGRGISIKWQKSQIVYFTSKRVTSPLSNKNY